MPPPQPRARCSPSVRVAVKHAQEALPTQPHNPGAPCAWGRGLGGGLLRGQTSRVVLIRGERAGLLAATHTKTSQ